jgi:DeoR/GlpR family transcriptional regulator of sugar metabolism
MPGAGVRYTEAANLDPATPATTALPVPAGSCTNAHRSRRIAYVLTDERRTLIVERVQRQGRVLAADLSEDLAVSPDTIRRDLRDLDEAGLLRRVHGGALPRRGDFAAPWAVRTRRAPEAKQSIAQRAAALVGDEQVVILDGGTTTLQVARTLPPDLRATVITNSPPIAVALADYPGLEVTVVGGTLRSGGLVTVGAAAVDALRPIRADIVFLGVCGVHPEIGVTTLDVEERLVKAAMIEGAGEVVALADHDKLGVALPMVVAPPNAITHLVTDAQAGEAPLAPYRRLGIEVLTA